MVDNEPTTIDGYTTGGLGIAVGTSLVFEEWRANPDMLKDCEGITQFRINVHTLVRNINEALEDNVTTLGTIVNHFTDEVELLTTLISEFFPGAEIIFYVTEMKYYNTVIPRVTIKNSRSARVREKANLEADAVARCYDSLKQAEQYKVERIARLDGHPSKVAIALTHLPADLLCHNHYVKLYLTESHTGRIRDLSTFIHKILPSHRRDNAQFIPFNQLSFYVYGDGNKMLSPAPPKVTKKYMELAVKAKWRTGTSKDKIIHDINVIKDADLLDWFAR